MSEEKNLFARYNLPSINRIHQGTSEFEMVEHAKAVAYAKQLPVKFSKICAPEQYANYLRKHIHSDINIDNTQNQLSFSGTLASELNALLSKHTDQHISVHLVSPKITIDEPLFIPSFVTIHGHNTILDAEQADIAIYAKESTQIEIYNMVIHAPKICGLLLLNCSHSRLSGLKITNSKDYAMILRQHCRYLHIDNCQFIDNCRSGLMIHENTHHIHVSHCEVTGIHHSSNWAAGIVITMLESVSEFLTQDAFEPEYFYPSNIEFKSESVPYRNIIENCHIHHNQSSGIYVDGGNGNILIGNTVEHNDKEGVCLDFYAIANVLLYNSIYHNGYRQKQSDHDLAIDFVLEFGRLADDSAVSKLPNISIDNAAYNIIIKNTISEAAGDGIKMVRAGFRNIIGLNSISDNNQGHNSQFSFSGILLGAAGCEVENDSSGLDRLPSLENIIFANHIYGSHHFGILYDKGSVYNDTIDNFILKQRVSEILEIDSPNSIIGNNFNKQTKPLSLIKRIFSSLNRYIN